MEKRATKPETCACGALLSAVTWTCVLGQYCPEQQRTDGRHARRQFNSVGEALGASYPWGYQSEDDKP